MVGSDADDNSGLLPTEGCAPGVSCEVGLSDAALHSGAIKTGTYSFCSDMNSDLQVDLTDAVVLSVGIKAGSSCPR